MMMIWSLGHCLNACRAVSDARNVKLYLSIKLWDSRGHCAPQHIFLFLVYTSVRWIYLVIALSHHFFLFFFFCTIGIIFLTRHVKLKIVQVPKTHSETFAFCFIQLSSILQWTQFQFQRLSTDDFLTSLKNIYIFWKMKLCFLVHIIKVEWVQWCFGAHWLSIT